MPEAISLKFGMWSTEVGGNLHSKICLVSSRQHRVTEVRKLHFVSSCQYTHGVARRLLGPHDTLPCVLIYTSTGTCPMVQDCLQSVMHFTLSLMLWIFSDKNFYIALEPKYETSLVYTLNIILL